ncbi:FtsQ-type POTRA domain-containing protein [Shigella flexneri]
MTLDINEVQQQLNEFFRWLRQVTVRKQWPQTK